MKVTINLHSGLERYSKDKLKFEEITIPENKNVTIQAIMDYYGFQKGEIGVVVMNEKLARKDFIVNNNDHIDFYPMFAGG